MAPRPRSLRLKATSSRKGRGAHVALEPPLAFRLTSATSAAAPLDAGSLIRAAARPSFNVLIRSGSYWFDFPANIRQKGFFCGFSIPLVIFLSLRIRIRKNLLIYICPILPKLYRGKGGKQREREKEDQLTPIANMRHWAALAFRIGRHLRFAEPFGIEQAINSGIGRHWCFVGNLTINPRL